MNKYSTTRRNVLKITGAVGALGASLLAGCAGSGNETGSNTTGTNTTTGNEPSGSDNPFSDTPTPEPVSGYAEDHEINYHDGSIPYKHIEIQDISPALYDQIGTLHSVHLDKIKEVNSKYEDDIFGEYDVLQETDGEDVNMSVYEFGTTDDGRPVFMLLPYVHVVDHINLDTYDDFGNGTGYNPETGLIDGDEMGSALLYQAEALTTLNPDEFADDAALYSCGVSQFDEHDRWLFVATPLEPDEHLELKELFEADDKFGAYNLLMDNLDHVK